MPTKSRNLRCQLFSTILTATLLSFSASALAQLPQIPGYDGNKPRSPATWGAEEKAEKKKDDKADEKKDAKEDKDAAPKKYAKPAPRPLPEGEARQLSGPIGLIEFSGMVNPGMGEFTVDSIHRAQKDGAQAVLIELDTPGGLVSTTQKMVQAIMKSKVPVIVFVTPSGAHAASAGTIITLAAHIAAMEPATRIGAAHPVTGGGKDPEAEGGKHMGRKIENDLAAMIEGIADERNRNQEWAIDAVRDSVSIHARDALEIGVIDIVARDREDLFAQLDGRELSVGGERVKLATKNPEIKVYTPNIREQLLNTLANPGIAMLLGVLGMIGIMVEIYHPGMIAPGVMGVLCILTSLIAMEQLPIDLGAGLLVLAGVGLLVAEMYTPTYGALGLLGVAGLTIGMLLLVDPTQPDFAIDDSFRLGLTDVVPLVVAFAGVSGLISYSVVRAQKADIFTGKEALIGAIGEVERPVGPSGGMVFVDGELWRAWAAQEIDKGAEVEIVKVEGMRVEVKRRGS